MKIGQNYRLFWPHITANGERIAIRKAIGVNGWGAFQKAPRIALRFSQKFRTPSIALQRLKIRPQPDRYCLFSAVIDSIAEQEQVDRVCQTHLCDLVCLWGLRRY